jgi:large subunit ribosomal protein L11
MGEKKITRALLNGGQATAGPPLGPALGPLGVNVMEIVRKINEVTKDYAGMKVPVQVSVDIETKEFEVIVGTPTTSALIVKELGITKGSGDPKNQKVGNLSIEQVIQITKLKQKDILSKDLKTGMKEVIGSCVSIGVTVNGKDPKIIQKEIDEGLYEETLNNF